MDTSHYASLEAGLGELLTALGQTFTPEQAAEVRGFVEVGEYGLALEEAIGILVEEGLRPPARAVAITDDLAARMEIANEPIVRGFHDRFAPV